MIAAVIPKDEFVKGLYWDMEDPYHYTRVTEFDKDNYMLITGGADHRVGAVTDPNELERRYQHLHAWTSERWPAVGPIRFRWSGHVCYARAD